ncbi:MAG: peptidoglycan-binding protein [Acidothermus sp.]|nr:peptidoglycan-binding protein [Acidothermus sp.]
MRRPSSPAWIVLLTLFVLPLVLLGAFRLLASSPNPTASAQPVDPIVVAVDRQEVRPQMPTTVTVTYADGAEIVSAASGVVTGTPEVGKQLANGDIALRVNDKPVRAFVSDAPFWRTLQPGFVGDDVRRLARFLRQLGFFSGTETDRYDSDLGRAVAAFNRAGGYGSSETFDPATVLWVGDHPLTVGQVLVSPGATITPGTPVLRGPKQAVAVAVQEPAGGFAAAADFSSGAQLVVGKVTVPYQLGSGTVTDPKAVAAIRGALSPADSGPATVQALAAKQVKVIPASALVTGADGTSCVYSSATSQPTIVQPIGGGVSTVQLPMSFPLQQVLANPGSVSVSHPCGS